MSRLTFDDLTPDDMPAPYEDDSGDRADAFRDSLLDCGKQTTEEPGMKTIERHLADNAANIEREARQYAERYAVSIEQARRDVADEYRQGWHEAADDARYSGGVE